MKKFRISEGTPKHIGQLLLALYDLQHLQNAHLEHLEKQHGTEEFPDSETVFMRAGITLLCSAWEAYVEDLARNGIAFLIENCKTPDDLPLEIRKNIAKEVKLDKNELAPWALAGDDWRTVVKSRFENAIAKAANSLNTPKSSNVKLVFSEMLGIDDVTKCWQWEFFNVTDVCELIDHLVIMRGSIAHGRSLNQPAETLRMIYLQAIVSQCAFLMNNFVREELLRVTRKDPWAMVRYTQDWTKFGIPIKTKDEPEK